MSSKKTSFFPVMAAAAGALAAAALALGACDGGSLFSPFAKSFLQVMPLRRNYHIDDLFNKEEDLKVYLVEVGDIPLDEVTIKVDGARVEELTISLDRLGTVPVDVAYNNMSARYTIYVLEPAQEGDDDDEGGIIINIPW